jgi:hypothetical protein
VRPYHSVWVVEQMSRGDNMSMATDDTWRASPHDAAAADDDDDASWETKCYRAKAVQEQRRMLARLTMVHSVVALQMSVMEKVADMAWGIEAFVDAWVRLQHRMFVFYKNARNNTSPI